MNMYERHGFSVIVITQNKDEFSLLFEFCVSYVY